MPRLMAQDTFSIVGLDTITGEVGSAGASCVDLVTITNPPFVPPDADFLTTVIPGMGAINTQAAYSNVNQTMASQRLIVGDSPRQILLYVNANDNNFPLPNMPPTSTDSTIRQMGIVSFYNGGPAAAAYTGINCINYKSHIVGRHYSIQGNILLGQAILDSMEARFLHTPGDLSCKLMAALQGAKVIGADTRCAANGSSSLFAFIKVAKPDDNMTAPSVNLKVRLKYGATIDPIDSLQKLFNTADITCTVNTTGIAAHSKTGGLRIAPNPVGTSFSISGLSDSVQTLVIVNMLGQEMAKVSGNRSTIDVSFLPPGYYLLQIYGESKGRQGTLSLLKY
jgi:uncharacterized Ntn-hydrolase superfamily protein